MNKSALRKEFINRRDSIPEIKRSEYSKAIAGKITGSNYFNNADTVLCFVSIGSEVDTSGIIGKAFECGKTVGVPFIEAGQMQFMQIGSIDELVTGKYGIPTAPDNSQVIDDFEKCLCIVPCLSADIDGYRLGYGGGYYDRFLAEHKNIYSIAVCFDELLSVSLPREEFDIKVSLVITERKETGVR